MIVKWGRSKSGLLAEDIDIDAIAGASELSLAEAEQIAIYFGLSNSLITYPNDRIQWYMRHKVGGMPAASFGPASPSLVNCRSTINAYAFIALLDSGSLGIVVVE